MPSGSRLDGNQGCDYQAARKYWKVLKGRLKKEGNETVTNCYQLKMLAPDGKMRSTDGKLFLPLRAGCR